MIVATLKEEKNRRRGNLSRDGDRVRVDFAINRGEWFGKTWLIFVDMGYEWVRVLAEADNEGEAIDALADSKRAYLIAIDEPEANEYTEYAGNYGIPVNLDNVRIFPCTVNYFAPRSGSYDY